jgi:hypothetical protein
MKELSVTRRKAILTELRSTHKGLHLFEAMLSTKFQKDISILHEQVHQLLEVLENPSEVE